MNEEKQLENVKYINATESTLQERSHLTLWSGRGKSIPPIPKNRKQYTSVDPEYWYEMEYGCLNVDRVQPIPSPGTGPKGKRIICVKSESDPYQKECELSMVETANNLGIDLSIVVSGWEKEKQISAFLEALASKPDLIINIPGVLSESTHLYKTAYEQGIPVISTILSPQIGAYSYVVSWCGHDAWFESRLLARKFAELMDYEGAFCIIQHMPDTSAFYSRTYGFLTELIKIAPKMKLLEMETSYLDSKITEDVVEKWVKKFGHDIKGIACSNDIAVLDGMNKALKALKRDDIIKVSNGTTKDGLHSLKAGNVDAITFKSPAIDGSLPIQLAADWFSGLLVDTIRFMPTHIITKIDVDEYLGRTDKLQDIDLKPLCDAIEQLDCTKIDTFFESIYLTLTLTKILSIEVFRGFTIDLNTEHIVGSYESVFKGLFNQPSIEATLEWMKVTAERLVEEIRNQSNLSTIKKVIQFVDQNISKPMSLKELSFQFNISPRYLGKLFYNDTGKYFNDYVKDCRLVLARTFLENTSMSVARISYQVGFENPNYFYKQFKLHTGVTPTEYREKSQQKQQI
jgi:AraC-like DNA-binding protein/ABC-type sugar transport system substrate-binding protein